jgi:hypothetical protein
MQPHTAPPEFLPSLQPQGGGCYPLNQPGSTAGSSTKTYAVMYPPHHSSRPAPPNTATTAACRACRQCQEPCCFLALLMAGFCCSCTCCCSLGVKCCGTDAELAVRLWGQGFGSRLLPAGGQHCCWRCMYTRAYTMVSPSLEHSHEPLHTRACTMRTRCACSQSQGTILLMLPAHDA